MNREDLPAVERLIWRRVLTVCRVVEGFHAIRGAGLPEDIDEVEVNRNGEGSLSWLHDELDDISRIEVGLPQGDRLPLALIHSDGKVERVTLLMVAQSNWSRAWYPVSQIREWPGEVLLTIDEEEVVKQAEADLFSVLAYDEQHQQYRLLSFRREEQPLAKVIEEAKKLESILYQQKFFKKPTMEEMRKNKRLRLDRDEPLDHRPKMDMVLTPNTGERTRCLPRSSKRLYAHDWVHRIVNLDNPVPYYRYTLKQQMEA